jgi:hypothetical protein
MEGANYDTSRQSEASQKRHALAHQTLAHDAPHDQFGITGRKTGLWWEESALPYRRLNEAGAEIVRHARQPTGCRRRAVIPAIECRSNRAGPLPTDDRHGLAGKLRQFSAWNAGASADCDGVHCGGCEDRKRRRVGIVPQLASPAVIDQFKVLMLAMLVVSPLVLFLRKPSPAN